MKKILALLLAVCLCLSITACNKNVDTTGISNITEGDECTELELRRLIETNIDCYYIFCVAPLSFSGDADDDGYYKADTNFFADYQALSDFVYAAFTDETAAALLSSPDESAPLYKNVDGAVYVNPDVVQTETYDVIWDDTYEIKFLSNSPTTCSFRLTSVTIEGEEYVTQGEAVHQGDSWILKDLVY